MQRRRPTVLKEKPAIIDADDLDPRPATSSSSEVSSPRDRLGRTSSTAGVGNIAPVSFFTVVGRMPPILSISLQPRSDGVTLKDTFVSIRDTGEFVVNITTIGQLRRRAPVALNSIPVDNSRPLI